MAEYIKPVIDRFLTVGEKSEILNAWGERISALPTDVPGEGDPRGFPDPLMIEWCRRINALKGVCTVQSCSGHRASDGAFYSGHLWLRMSRGVSDRFERQAFNLAGQRGIERVSKLYMHGGEEVIVLEFQGQEHDRLDSSMGAVLRFLTEITTAVDGGAAWLSTSSR